MIKLNISQIERVFLSKTSLIKFYVFCMNQNDVLVLSVIKVAWNWITKQIPFWFESLYLKIIFHFAIVKKDHFFINSIFQHFNHSYSYFLLFYYNMNYLWWNFFFFIIFSFASKLNWTQVIVIVYVSMPNETSVLIRW